MRTWFYVKLRTYGNIRAKACLCSGEICTAAEAMLDPESCDMVRCIWCMGCCTTGPPTNCSCCWWWCWWCWWCCCNGCWCSGCECCCCAICCDLRKGYLQGLFGASDWKPLFSTPPLLDTPAGLSRRGAVPGCKSRALELRRRRMREPSPGGSSKLRLLRGFR